MQPLEGGQPGKHENVLLGRSTMSYRHTVVATAIITLILVSACGTPLPTVTSVPPTGTPIAGTTPAVSNTQPAVPDIAADLQRLDIDTFFEASYN
jgi:hypothetical protein